MAELTEMQRSVMAALRGATKALKSRELAARVFRTKGYTSETLRQLRKMGLVDTVGRGSGARWLTATAAAALLEAQALITTADTDTDTEDDGADSMARPARKIQIIKQAGTYQPLQVRGPISVFCLA